MVGGRAPMEAMVMPNGLMPSIEMVVVTMLIEVLMTDKVWLSWLVT